ncbi:Ser/Thr protein phosphatase family protein [Clostridiaceae bacterium JG1575]|nr:Ser/Thr protein phosphatase family protein [Clostridiaceae bacterium JG1575]
MKTLKAKTPWILGALFLVLMIAGLDGTLKTVTYAIPTQKVQKPIRLAIAADLHSCYYGPNQEDLLQALEESRADALLLPGDIFDDVGDNENTRIFLTRVAAKLPTFYVTGNHEYWSKDAPSMVDFVKSQGITVLDGTQKTVLLRNQPVTFYGVDDPEVDRYLGKTPDFQAQLAAVHQSPRGPGLHVLLAHRPELITDYLKGSYDLIVSGHAHGGQWRIPFLLNGLYAPDQGLIPKYAGGRYDFASSVFVVSRGLARESTRVPRIFNRPEWVLADFLPKP